MLKTVMMLAVLLFCAVLGAGAQTPKGWETFTPPSKEYTVLMPPDVKSSIRNLSGQTEHVYHQTDTSGVPYGVSEGLHINPRQKVSVQADFYKLVVNHADEQLKKSTKKDYKLEETEVSGKGWHGKKALFQSNGDGLATFVVAYSNGDDVVYTLFAGDGEEHANVKWFLDSFELDPKMASKTHSDLAKSAKTANFVSIVWTVSLFILGAAALSIVVSIVRNRGK